MLRIIQSNCKNNFVHHVNLGAAANVPPQLCPLILQLQHAYVMHNRFVGAIRENPSASSSNLLRIDALSLKTTTFGIKGKSSSNAGLDKMKKLVGTWVSADKDGKAPDMTW